MDILNEIDRVFRLEIETLTKVREAVDENYARAARLLFECSGKVVVTGMGKSGVIAQKISATMVSTGTLAIFLHPGDALHGDVGVIREGDVVVAISKSGETEELLNIFPYVKKVGVPIISITAGLESTVAKESEVVLFTPVDEEACPLNLAPTSSTTAALVVGDALAIALMRMRGLEPDQFAQLHPGGQLGKRLLMTVADIMRSGKDNPMVDIHCEVREMLVEISSKRCGAVSVVNDKGLLVGLVTDYDLRRAMERGGDIFSQSIQDIMNVNPTPIFSDDMAVTALTLMEDRDRPFLVVPVVERASEQVVGMVHLHDLVAKGL
jgi:arabinose-5-phosphate isomerase